MGILGMSAAGGAVAGLSGAPSAALCESALSILLPRRHAGGPALRLACRALVRRWVACLRAARSVA